MILAPAWGCASIAAMRRGVPTFNPAAMLELRRRRGLSHDALVERMGSFNRAHVIGWEKGHMRPTAPNLARLAEALEVEPAKLMTVTLARATLADLRDRVGLTQRQLAEGLGISSAWWGRIELGTAVPRAELIAPLAEALGVREAVVRGALGRTRRHAQQAQAAKGSTGEAAAG